MSAGAAFAWVLIATAQGLHDHGAEGPLKYGAALVNHVAGAGNPRISLWFWAGVFSLLAAFAVMRRR